jgi:hypothetical protein
MTYTAESVATYYTALFFTSDRHSIWGGQHWQPQSTEPPTEVIVAALAGDGPSVSVYFMADDATTHVAAIDIDAEQGWPAIELITARLLDAGVVAYPEHSRRGGHIWIVADRRLPAIVWRFALMAAIEAAGLDPASKSIELRPNTHRRSSEYAGGALRAPWMAHPATGERFGLLDPRTLRPLHQKVAGALLDFVQADHRLVSALAERYMPVKMAPTPITRHKPAAQTEGITDVLGRAWGIDAHAGQSIRCPLHNDRHPSFKIARDDLRAWCHSPACIAHENGRGITPWRLAQLAPGVAA